MKKILLIILLLIPVLGFSQTTKPIDGFLGIKFGATKAMVLAAIKAKGGKLEDNSSGELVFTNVHLGKRDVEELIVNFVNNKAYAAEFAMQPKDDYHAIEYYDSLVSDLNEIYGIGEATRKLTSSSSADPEGQVGDLLIGAADLHTTWTSANKNLLNASIISFKDDDGETSLKVLLIYQNAELAALDSKNQKAKDKSDY